MKIIVAGNKDYGLANSLYKMYPDALFLSRSTGFNLWDKTTKEKVSALSLDCDIFLSVSALGEFNQTLLVEHVIKQWEANNHKGYLIVVGSSADTPVKGTTWLYPTEKKALRSYCRQLSQHVASDQPPSWKVTYISPGNMHTPKQDSKMPTTLKLDCDYVAKTIGWLISQPPYVNISELCLDRIQISDI